MSKRNVISYKQILKKITPAGYNKLTVNNIMMIHIKFGHNNIQSMDWYRINNNINIIIKNSFKILVNENISMES